MTSINHILAAYGTHNLDSARNPHPLHAVLRNHAPIHQVTLDSGRQAWIVTDYTLAKTVFTDPRFSNDPNNRSDITIDTTHRHMGIVDPPEHHRLRTAISRHFTPKNVEKLRPDITTTVTETLRANGPTLDLATEFAAVISLRVIFDLLGIPRHDQPPLIDGLQALSATAGIGETAQAGITRVRDYLTNLINTHTHTPGDTILATLHNAVADGKISHDELIATTFLLIAAGHETTVNLITVTIDTLLRHPDQWQHVRANPHLIPAAIEETLRYEAPAAHSTGRYTTDTVTIGQTTIPAGQLVLVNLKAVNRDPACVKNPDTFDITRHLPPHLAFGYKRHICLGAALARLEADIAITALADTHHNLKPVTPLDDIEWRANIALRGPKNYPVHLQTNATSQLGVNNS